MKQLWEQSLQSMRPCFRRDLRILSSPKDFLKIGPLKTFLLVKSAKAISNNRKKMGGTSSKPLRIWTKLRRSCPRRCSRWKAGNSKISLAHQPPVGEALVTTKRCTQINKSTSAATRKMKMRMINQMQERKATKRRR